MTEKFKYAFLTDQISYEIVETKSGKKHFVTGYISTSEVDIYNDLVTPAALKSMLEQINERTVTIDYDHEAWREDLSRLPTAKIVEAKIDSKGLWVKAQLNSDSPKFKALWGSVKNGFITAFSIAFKPLKVVTKRLNDTKVRVIEDLKLLNVAFTGVPVNQGATVDGYSMKSVILKAISETDKTTEDTKMSEEEKKPDAPAEESKAEESAPAADASVEEKACKKAEGDKKKDKDEEEDGKKKKMDLQPEKKSELTEVLAQLKSLTEKQDELSKAFEELKSKPVLKSVQTDVPDVQAENKEMLNLIK